MTGRAAITVAPSSPTTERDQRRASEIAFESERSRAERTFSVAVSPEARTAKIEVSLPRIRAVVQSYVVAIGIRPGGS